MDGWPFGICFDLDQLCIFGFGYFCKIGEQEFQDSPQISVGLRFDWVIQTHSCSCFWTTPVQLWQYAFYNWTSTMFSSLKQAFFLDSAVHLGPPIFAIISPDQLHQHLSTSWLCGWCFQGDEQCWVFIKCSALNRGQKDPVWTHSYREPFSVCLGCSLTNAILTWSVTFGEIISLISPEWVVECL